MENTRTRATNAHTHARQQARTLWLSQGRKQKEQAQVTHGEVCGAGERRGGGASPRKKAWRSCGSAAQNCHPLAARSKEHVPPWGAVVANQLRLRPFAGWFDKKYAAQGTPPPHQRLAIDQTQRLPEWCVLYQKCGVLFGASARLAGPTAAPLASCSGAVARFSSSRLVPRGGEHAPPV